MQKIGFGKYKAVKCSFQNDNQQTITFVGYDNKGIERHVA